MPSMDCGCLRAECRGTHSFDDIVGAVYAGTMQFWPAENACAVTEIVTFPRRKVLHIFLAGGEMQEIVDMDGPAADFAKANGCTAMTIAGRRGWKKDTSCIKGILKQSYTSPNQRRLICAVIYLVAVARPSKVTIPQLDTGANAIVEPDSRRADRKNGVPALLRARGCRVYSHATAGHAVSIRCRCRVWNGPDGW
jgi:hypothetical protein